MAKEITPVMGRQRYRRTTACSESPTAYFNDLVNHRVRVLRSNSRTVRIEVVDGPAIEAGTTMDVRRRDFNVRYFEEITQERT